MKVMLDRQDWSEARFEAMRRAMEWSQAETLGVLTLFWHGTREAGIIEATRERLMMYLSVHPNMAGTVFDVMKTVGYVQQRKPITDSWLVLGNEAAVGLAKSRREWGKLRGKGNAKKKASLAPAPAPVAVEVKPSKAAETRAARDANRACWEAYSAAYKQRWHVDPLRDMKANAMIANFVRRIGREQAPGVIRFYVEHDDYVKQMHSLNCALRDAEAIYAQFQRGSQITRQEIRAFEEEQRVRGQLDRVARGQL